MATLFHINNGMRERAALMIFLFRRDGLVLVGHLCKADKFDHPSVYKRDIINDWEPARGGVDQNDHDLMATAYRELKEEYGYDAWDVNFIAASQHAPLAPFPDATPEGKYAGMRVQTAAFLVNDGAQWDVETWHNNQPPEFDGLQWARLGSVPDIMPPERKNVGIELVPIYKPVECVLRQRWLSSEEISAADLAKEVQRKVVVPGNQLGIDFPSFPGVRAGGPMRGSDTNLLRPNGGKLAI